MTSQKRKKHENDLIDINLMCIGDDKIGKTWMLISYVTNGFSTEYVPKVFNSSANTIVDGNKIQLYVWDSTTKGTYENMDIFLICYCIFPIIIH